MAGRLQRAVRAGLAWVDGRTQGRVRATLRAYTRELDRLQRSVAPGAPAGGLSLRHWEGAESHRSNEAHWARAADSSINTYLLSHLATLRKRCVYESRNNPHVASAVERLALTIVGRSGPVLQVQSSSRPYAEAAEEVWAERWAAADVAGKLSGAELLRLAVASLPTHGEFLWQLVRAADADDPGGAPWTKVHAIDSRRLEALYSLMVEDAQGTHVILGIRRTREGRPIEYSLRMSDDAIAARYRWEWVSAADVVHEYPVIEPGQARGVPLLAPAIDASLGQLRDFDDATLAAARVAAEHGVILEATGPQVEWHEADSEIEWEPGMVSTIPPGYHASHIRPEHPSTNYIDYRHERLRELGLLLHMPLMMVLLDSSKHNYSSARFDGQMLERAAAVSRAWLERRVLGRLAKRWFMEARLAGRLPADPRRTTLRWDWEPMPHVDPEKEARATQVRVATGVSTLTHECAAQGLDYEEDILDTLVKEREAREARGLPEPTGQVPPQRGPQSSAAMANAGDEKSEGGGDGGEGGGGAKKAEQPDEGGEDAKEEPKA